MSLLRKESKMKEHKFYPGADLQIYVNKQDLSYYTGKTLHNPELTEILSLLDRGTYLLESSGGGISSIAELIPKTLYLHLSLKNKAIIKNKYNHVSKTDSRAVIPKTAGGKARARYQKSYR